MQVPHVVRWTSEYCPGGHDTQVVAPETVLINPSAQSVQLVAEVTLAYVPAVQFVQEVLVGEAK